MKDGMKRVAILVVLSLAGPAAAQDDPLRTARDLYASAAYEEALSELTRFAGTPAPAVAREMAAYRAFCLMALGRTAEAETIAESLVREDPTLTLDRYRDVSPRIAAMFASVRMRVLPQLIRDEYRTARSLAVARAPDAESRLKHVRELLGEAQEIGAWDETLADLRVLVDGFLELSRASAPAASPAAATPAAATGARLATSLPPGPPSSAPATTASAGDTGVVAPIVISQPAPQVPPGLLDLVKRLRRTGTIDVVIDERGTVEDVIVKQSVNSAYDALVVAAARTWKYRPALKDGVPVKFVKTVAINVKTE
jgi:TonB family protein